MDAPPDPAVIEKELADCASLFEELEVYLLPIDVFLYHSTLCYDIPVLTIRCLPNCCRRSMKNTSFLWTLYTSWKATYELLCICGSACCLFCGIQSTVTCDLFILITVREENIKGKEALRTTTKRCDESRYQGVYMASWECTKTVEV